MVSVSVGVILLFVEKNSSTVPEVIYNRPFFFFPPQCVKEEENGMGGGWGGHGGRHFYSELLHSLLFCLFFCLALKGNI